VTQQLQVLLLPFVACLVLTGIHAYLGIHVISRKVIFVDIALAQIAALGATVAFLLGYDPRSEGAYYFSLAFAILAAVIFALTRARHERVPQEAVIGLTYATASAAAILLADLSPHGAEHLHDLLAGSIVWVTPRQVIQTAILYTIIGAFHVAFRRRFLLISLDPEEAYRQGVRVRLWDFLFYLSFGVVITSSVQIAGVLLVFCYLVAPSVFAVMFFDDLRSRLLTGWTMGTLVSAVGLLFSYDRPSGPMIIVGFALALILGGTVRAVVKAENRGRAVAVAVGCAVLMAASGWGLYRFRPTGADPDERSLASAPGASPEHAVAGDLRGLRAALSDTHEQVRVDAVNRLAAGGDPRVLPDLVAALHDQSAAVREAAAVALLHRGNRDALPALEQALRNADEDPWVRLRLAQATASLGDEKAASLLVEIAREGEGALTRLEALRSVAQLTGIRATVPDDPDAPAAAEILRQAEAWLDRGDGRRR
jgi:zinc/manganese transport system permease protein